MGFALGDLYPDNFLTDPAQRCFDIFKAMFIDTYKREYGDGIKLKELKSRVEVSYAPSSYAVSQFIERCVTNLSDVSFSQPYIKKLSKVVDLCTSLLEPYSRYLGRNVGQKHLGSFASSAISVLANSHETNVRDAGRGCWC